MERNAPECILHYPFPHHFSVCLRRGGDYNFFAAKRQISRSTPIARRRLTATNRKAEDLLLQPPLPPSPETVCARLARKLLLGMRRGSGEGPENGIEVKTVFSSTRTPRSFSCAGFVFTGANFCAGVLGKHQGTDPIPTFVFHLAAQFLIKT